MLCRQVLRLGKGLRTSSDSDFVTSDVELPLSVSTLLFREKYVNLFKNNAEIIPAALNIHLGGVIRSEMLKLQSLHTTCSKSSGLVILTTNKFCETWSHNT
jgi:hypothetical protein